MKTPHLSSRETSPALHLPSGYLRAPYNVPRSSSALLSAVVRSWIFVEEISTRGDSVSATLRPRMKFDFLHPRAMDPDSRGLWRRIAMIHEHEIIEHYTTQYGTVRRCYDNTSIGENRFLRWFYVITSSPHKFSDLRLRTGPSRTRCPRTP